MNIEIELFQTISHIRTIEVPIEGKCRPCFPSQRRPSSKVVERVERRYIEIKKGILYIF